MMRIGTRSPNQVCLREICIHPDCRCPRNDPWDFRKMAGQPETYKPPRWLRELLNYQKEKDRPKVTLGGRPFYWETEEEQKTLDNQE